MKSFSLNKQGFRSWWFLQTDGDQPLQPNNEAVSLVDPETIDLYFRLLFQFEGQWLPGYCGLRGISEPIKGAAVNDFHEINEDLPGKVIDKVKEWTANGMASFVI